MGMHYQHGSRLRKQMVQRAPGPLETSASISVFLERQSPLAGAGSGKKTGAIAGCDRPSVG